MIQKITDPAQKQQIAAHILHALPDWFGLPDSTAHYIEACQHMPFWAAIVGDEAVGFIALNETSAHAIDIFVMGVLRAQHRQGIGHALVAAALAYAKQHGYTFLHVKTVKEGCYNEYDQTIAFYRKVGFKELECFPTLWDEWNPCQLLVRVV